MNNFETLSVFLKDMGRFGCQVSTDRHTIVIEGPGEKLKSIVYLLFSWESMLPTNPLNEFEIQLDLGNNYLSLYHKYEYHEK